MAVEDRPSLDRAAQPHRLALPHLTDTEQGPRRPVPARRDPGHQGDPGAPARRDVLGPRRGAGPLPSLRRPRSGAAGRVGGPSGLFRRATGRAWDAAWAGRGLAGWEAKLPDFRGGRRDRHPQGHQRLPHRHRRCDPRTGGRGGRPDRQHRHAARRTPRRQSPEHPGGRQVYFGIREHGMGAVMTGMACHGGDPAGRWDLLRLQRLHARGSPPGRALPGPRHLLVDPRLGRSGPGRADPPADRAPGIAAGHARPVGGPTGRRQRDRPGLAAGRRRETVPPPWY